MFKYAIKWGLILGILSALITFLFYLAGPGSFANMWMGLIVFVFNVTVWVVLGVRYRKANGNVLEFKNAFTLLSIIILVSMAISTLFSILLFNVIDPAFADQVQEAIINSTVSMMEKFGAPEEEIDKTIEKLQESGNNFSASAMIRGFAWNILFSGIIALIIAAIIKRKPLIFDTTNEG